MTVHLRRPQFILFALLLAPLSLAADNGGLVAFGDSLSDMGNRWVHSTKPNLKFKQTWVAQLAGPDMLNVPGFKPSGMQSYCGGTNYAVGGAGTEFTAKLATERNGTQNLSQQVSERYLNPKFNTDGVRKAAIHVIVIGANDLMLASIDPAQVLAGWADFDQVGLNVARSAEAQIQALAKAGVTRIAWGNVFDVTQAPAISGRAKILGPEMSARYLTAVAKGVAAHNQEMDAAIDRLHKANPSLRIIKLDLFGQFAKVAANPRDFGFTEVTRGANDSDHLFSADGLHPTPAGHKMLAKFAFEVITKTKKEEAGNRNLQERK